MRIIAIIFYIQWIMITGCHSGQNIESSGDQLPVVNYNGTKVSLNKQQVERLTDQLETLFYNCDDFYELIVSDNLIDEIKSKEKFFEIVFPQEIEMEAGKFGKQKIKKVFIPLSGKYASTDQVTFFYGIDNFANTPFSNSKGAEELKTLLNGMMQ